MRVLAFRPVRWHGMLLLRCLPQNELAKALCKPCLDISYDDMYNSWVPGEHSTAPSGAQLVHALRALSCERVCPHVQYSAAPVDSCS